MLCDKEESYYGKRTAKMSTKITKQLRQFDYHVKSNQATEVKRNYGVTELRNGQDKRN